ncbi:MAG: CoA ester lyase [Gammaproteobacteria bacterium]|nr:CoA ester lyase [Gammaproteobacteria bacterium]NND53443.1 CoA ester lyase [Gammaproteobacteria bacterium]
MPGDNERAMDKARELAADVVIFDLEDAVAPENKETARQRAVAAVREGGYGNREVLIRVNGRDTPWGEDDLRAVATSGVSGVVLPKVETPGSVTEAIRGLDGAGGPADLPVWAMAETPAGILNISAIVTNQPRMTAVVMGTSDLARDLRVIQSADRSGLLYSLSRCVLAARAHGIDIIDGVHLALDDSDGYRTACEQGRELGFDGKSLIHPRQIADANAVFGISDAEADLAREIVSAWKAARAAERGVTVVRGQLIEQLHVDDAERIIALHEASQALRN